MSTDSTPRSPSPNVAPWRAWQGWAALIVGAYLLLAPLWTSGAPGGWFITLGVAIGLTALWQLGSALSSGSNWVQIVAGAASFVAPWFGGFGSTAAGWTLWIAAAALIVVSVVALTNTSRRYA